MRRSSDRNPDAADDELRRDLMNAGPFCRGVDNKIVACSANATRTKRAGIRELKYAADLDRWVGKVLRPQTHAMWVRRKERWALRQQRRHATRRRWRSATSARKRRRSSGSSLSL